MRKKSRRPSPAFKILGAIWWIGVMLVACFVGVVANMASRSSFIKKLVVSPLSMLNVDPKQVFHDYDGLTLLILGTDDDRVMTGWAIGPNGKPHAVSKVSRRGARADMILVAKLDFDRNTITGLSIPRDTACRLPGYDTKKINAYYSVAKPGQQKDLMTRAVEYTLPGVKIDRTIALNYDAFQKLVDMVGGVPVVVPKGRKGNGLQYDDNAGDLHIHLKPGPQTLDGVDAMGYVRFRHDSESDFGRQERQKEFITSFKSRVLHNLFALPEIAEQSKAVMDNALSDQEIWALVAFSRRVPPGSIRLGMLPTYVHGRMLKVVESKRDEAIRQYNLLSGDGGTAAVNE